MGRLNFRDLLHLDDQPHKIAGGLAVGVFIGFSPFYGAHMILAVLLAFLFRLNKVAAIAGTWVVLPWFVPFVLSFAYLLGRFLMGKGIGFPQDFCLEREWILQNLLPLWLGCTVMGVGAAGSAYFIARRVLEKRRKTSLPGDGRPSAQESTPMP
ncbi:MAG: DUF2062 domain-containing protein [candidate division NC10 bacterium]|nr:DUF2062 domain-containing protein [candidate division NC10 bacterium]